MSSVIKPSQETLMVIVTIKLFLKFLVNSWKQFVLIYMKYNNSIVE